MKAGSYLLIKWGPMLVIILGYKNGNQANKLKRRRESSSFFYMKLAQGCPHKIWIIHLKAQNFVCFSIMEVFKDSNFWINISDSLSHYRYGLTSFDRAKWKPHCRVRADNTGDILIHWAATVEVNLLKA
ncbi:unnamed protein product [Cuscuta epithymum]|uniref:Uncharacterized protein n=1 Tax=Cuscuta epithymum TaxID=186058 RepID=A0AAV0FXB4_9ASTE|nr:unnamed protein product [Cuscuta epithymum]